MTVDDHLFIDLVDILAVQFRCRDCATTVGHPPEKWSPYVFRCPNCGLEWLGGDQPVALKAVMDFSGALKALLGPDHKARPFGIRLQVEHPKR